MKKLFLFFILLSSLNVKASTTINISYPLLGTIFVAQVGLVLEKTDILKKHGFDAKVTALGTGKELKVAMVGNKSDVILTSESNFVVLRGTQFEAYAFSTLGSAGRMALLVKSNDKIQKLNDLNGKKIGAIFGTTVHKDALEWKNKIGSETTEVINLGSVASILSALEAGTIDAGMVWDPFLENAISTSKFKMLGYTEFDLVNIISAEYSKKYPKTENQLNTALKDAIFYLVKNKNEVNGWYSDLVKIDKNVIDRATKINTNYNVLKKDDINLKIDKQLVEKMEKVNDFFLKEKVIPTKAILDGYIH
jgi:sulfonate transport system substrate-binding protein